MKYPRVSAKIERRGLPPSVACRRLSRSVCPFNNGSRRLACGERFDFSLPRSACFVATKALSSSTGRGEHANCRTRVVSSRAWLVCSFAMRRAAVACRRRRRRRRGGRWLTDIVAKGCRSRQMAGQKRVLHAPDCRCVKRLHRCTREHRLAYVTPQQPGRCGPWPLLRAGSGSALEPGARTALWC